MESARDEFKKKKKGKCARCSYFISYKPRLRQGSENPADTRKQKVALSLASLSGFFLNENIAPWWDISESPPATSKRTWRQFTTKPEHRGGSAAGRKNCR